MEYGCTESACTRLATQVVGFFIGVKDFSGSLQEAAPFFVMEQIIYGACVQWITLMNRNFDLRSISMVV